MPRLTVKQTAAALGCSVRTVRRRIAEGELSATKERRGQVDVTVLDPAEVARFAEAQGHTMTLPEGTAGTPAQPAASEYDSKGQEADAATVAPAASEGQSEGGGGRQGQAEGQTLPLAVTGSGLTVGQVRALQEQLRAITEERDFLRRVLENVTKALPEGTGSAQQAPAEEPEGARRATDRRSWWARLFRGKGEGGHE